MKSYKGILFILLSGITVCIVGSEPANVTMAGTSPEQLFEMFEGSGAFNDAKEMFDCFSQTRAIAGDETAGLDVEDEDLSMGHALLFGARYGAQFAQLMEKGEFEHADEKTKKFLDDMERLGSSLFDQTDKFFELVANNGPTDEIGQMLAAKPGLLTQQDVQGKTALHIAVEKGYHSLVEFLLKKGANIHQKVGSGFPTFDSFVSGQEPVNSAQGKTALDLAREQGFKNTQNLLIAHIKKLKKKADAQTKEAARQAVIQQKKADANMRSLNGHTKKPQTASQQGKKAKKKKKKKGKSSKPTPASAPVVEENQDADDHDEGDEQDEWVDTIEESEENIENEIQEPTLSSTSTMSGRVPLATAPEIASQSKPVAPQGHVTASAPSQAVLSSSGSLMQGPGSNALVSQYNDDDDQDYEGDCEGDDYEDECDIQTSGSSLSTSLSGSNLSSSPSMVIEQSPRPTVPQLHHQLHSNAPASSQGTISPTVSPNCPGTVFTSSEEPKSENRPVNIFDEELHKQLGFVAPEITGDDRITQAKILTLLKAAKKGNLALLQACLAKGVSVNAKSLLGSTALLTAGFAGHPNIVDYLLSQKADIEATNSLDQSVAYTALQQLFENDNDGLYNRVIPIIKQEKKLSYLLDKAKMQWVNKTIYSQQQKLARKKG